MMPAIRFGLRNSTPLIDRVTRKAGRLLIVEHPSVVGRLVATGMKKSSNDLGRFFYANNWKAALIVFPHVQLYLIANNAGGCTALWLVTSSNPFEYDRRRRD